MSNVFGFSNKFISESLGVSAVKLMFKPKISGSVYKYDYELRSVHQHRNQKQEL